MDKKQKLLEMRERLDNTLAMPDLVDEASIRSLVKDQLLRSSFNGNEGNIDKAVEKRAVDVSTFLGMLRSASGKDQKAVKAHESSYNEWKIKQDTDQLRVMYREGPHGTPYHTLLAEGFADGPVDVCLCVSWESTLYRKWWPQYNFPTFKIIESTCLRKVCLGEDISLVRVKVSWPVSDREALLHYFEIEYFKEDLIIILLKTILDTEDLDVSTHGFDRDGIPKADNTVRIDIIGGFVLQKVESTRSYFRMIANMDIKLDFVPPSLINFIARQLIGNGHKLYQKAVSTVASSDDEYRRALEGPMYARIREGLNSHNKPKVEVSDGEKHRALILYEHNNSAPNFVETAVTEIVEEETDQNQTSSIMEEEAEQNQTISTTSSSSYFSAEVEFALRTLDQAIAFVRGSSGINQSGSNKHPVSEPVISSLINSEDCRNNSKVSATSQANYNQTEFTEQNGTSFTSHERSKEVTTITIRQPPISESMSKVCDEESLNTNGFHKYDSPTVTKSYSISEQGKKKRKKKQWFCCSKLNIF